MKIKLVVAAILAIGGVAFAADEKPAKAGRRPGNAAAAKANTLTPEQAQGGWILLFDGSTPFGWKAGEDGCAIADGLMTVGGPKAVDVHTTTEFCSFVLSFQYRGENLKGAQLVLNGEKYDLQAGPKPGAWVQGQFTVEGTDKEHTVAAVYSGPAGKKILKSVEPATKSGPSRGPVGFHVPADTKIQLRNVMLKPLGAKPIFNGKDLTGWKPLPDHASKFTVTDKGEINVKNGNGDLQSEGQWQDFILQLDVISNGENLNSGIFFRALPGEFWQGYEVQIRNEWKGYDKGKPRDPAHEDRTQPVDCGTGGIYGRQPTRKVVSNDHEWFTVTLVAGGDHFSTWVNGYQCADYTDTKADAPSARKGRFLGKGCITIQGHDPTTDLSFKNIRVAEYPKKAAK